MNKTLQCYFATVSFLILFIVFNANAVLSNDNSKAGKKKAELHYRVQQLEKSHSREYIAKYLVDGLKTGKYIMEDLLVVAMTWQTSSEAKHSILLYRGILQNTDKKSKKVPLVNALLAEALVIEGKVEEAISFLEKTMGDRNGTTWERSALGQSYYAKKDYKKALSHCAAAVIIDPLFLDPCWFIISNSEEKLPQSRSGYTANFKGKNGKTYPVEARQFVGHFLPEYWDIDKLYNASTDYRKVADRLSEIGAEDISQKVKERYLIRAFDLAKNALSNSDSKSIFKALSCIDRVVPFMDLKDPYRKSFHFLSALGYLDSMNYRASIDSIELLLLSKKKLLLNYNKDGEFVCHLVLKLLDLVLGESWLSISWDKKTGHIRSKDMLDFSGHPVSIDADQGAVDRREVVRIALKKSDLESMNKKGQNDKIIYLKPYGSVSSSEDLTTLRTCQKNIILDIFPNIKVEESPIPFHCGGPRTFTNFFIKDAPPLPPSPDLDGAIQYALSLGDLELATKDLIIRIQNSFSAKSLNKEIFFDDMFERLRNIQQAKAKHINIEYDRHTLVAIYIAEKSLTILKKMSQLINQ